MEPVTIVGALRSAWNTFKKAPVRLMVLSFGMFVVSTVISAILNTDRHHDVITGIILSVADLFAQLVLTMVVYLYALNVLGRDAKEVPIASSWRPERIQNYLLTTFVCAGGFVAGLVFLIIPGLIVLVLWIFAPLIALDKNVGPKQAITESYRLVRPHFFKMLGAFIVMALLLLVGILALLVGVFAAYPIVILMFVQLYRSLGVIAGHGGNSETAIS